MAYATLAQISRRNLQDFEASSPPIITDVEHLTSYSWIEAPTPTIAVPGCPPRWSPPTVPVRLKKDSGLVYIAQNAARHPESPLEPLFRALYITNPSFDIRSTDIVTDRNNIRKLLTFVNPKMARNGLEPFTINIEMQRNTVIFCRHETATYEYIKPHEFRGFGHEFEKAYTVNQIDGSTGHHRIISYRFGNLNYIIRYEADGYVVADAESSSLARKKPEADGLSSLFDSLSLSTNVTSSNLNTAGSKLSIEDKGEAIPLASILEIKTRVSHKPVEIREIAPQLWVSQTSKLVRAYHQKGIFQRPEIEDVASQIKEWEKENQGDLSKLAALIDKILSVVKEGGEKRAVIKYDDKKDELVIEKTDRKLMLPLDLYSKWDDPDALEGTQKISQRLEGCEAKSKCIGLDDLNK